MSELLTESIKLVNLPFTILLGLVVLYWVLYLLGALGSDVLDFMGLDLDGDVDLDVDADVDADVDVSAGSSGSLLAGFLHFFYVGELPVLMIFSVLILSMWTLSMVINRLLHNASVWVAMLLFIPILLGGLVITKSMIMPFAPWLRKVFDQTSDRIEVVGKTCTISSVEATEQYGQAELTTEGAPLLLNVKAKEGITLIRGDEAIVYEYDKAQNTYLVAKFDIDARPSTEE